MHKKRTLLALALLLGTRSLLEATKAVKLLGDLLVQPAKRRLDFFHFEICLWVKKKSPTGTTGFGTFFPLPIGFFRLLGIFDPQPFGLSLLDPFLLEADLPNNQQRHLGGVVLVSNSPFLRDSSGFYFFPK